MATLLTIYSVVQSLNSLFPATYIGVKPRREKKESRITCMRMLEKELIKNDLKEMHALGLELLTKWRIQLRNLNEHVSESDAS